MEIVSFRPGLPLGAQDDVFLCAEWWLEWAGVTGLHVGIVLVIVGKGTSVDTVYGTPFVAQL